MTQAEIGEVIGVGEGTVKQHSVLMNKIVTQVLDACKQYQNGRVTVEVTPVTFDFTEGWFRTSGLYDLTAEFTTARHWPPPGESENAFTGE